MLEDPKSGVEKVIHLRSPQRLPSVLIEYYIRECFLFY